MRDYKFGNFLQELRKQKGLSQYQLGALVGVSNKAVSKWENGTAKPQSATLYKLSEVLGVTVDELFAGKMQKSCSKNGVFCRKREIWERAAEELKNRYGQYVPIAIANRFEHEKAEMKNSDIVVYFDLFAKIVSKARKYGAHVGLGIEGSSFVAFLLGATEVNPLEPHYYCPACKKTEFVRDAASGWDLEPKVCTCGKAYIRDGHSIPFDTCRSFLREPMRFNIAVAPSFYDSALTCAAAYFQGYRLFPIVNEKQRHFKTFAVVPAEELEICRAENMIRYPHITMRLQENYDLFGRIEKVTNTVFGRIPFLDKAVLDAFRGGDLCGIVGFDTLFYKNLLGKISIRGYADLIKICGFAHGTGTWFDNAEELLQSGRPLADIIAYREDVFYCIQKCMRENGHYDAGIAYTVMDNAMHGVYARENMDKETVQMLRDMGLDEYLITSIQKFFYLFSKAHGVLYVKQALILMWYKLNCPEAFRNIFLS